MLDSDNDKKICNKNDYLVECMSYMRVSIGVRRSVMKAELLFGFPLFLPGVQLCKSTLLQSNPQVERVYVMIWHKASRL